MLLSNIIDEYKQYNLKLIDKSDLISWLDENISIAYIPVIKKYAEIHRASQEFAKNAKAYTNSESDLELIYLLYDITFLFDVVFSVCKIEYSDNENKNSDIYDFVVEYGFYDYLKEKMGTDFVRLEEMFARSTGINDLYIVNIIRGAIDETISTEDIDKLNSIFKSMTPKKLDKMNEFMAYNNPMMKEAIESNKKIALETADKVMKERKNIKKD